MNCHTRRQVYNCANSRQSDQFINTTKEIADYVRRTYKFGGDVRLAIEGLKLPEIA
jgi:hypothetical protein